MSSIKKQKNIILKYNTIFLILNINYPSLLIKLIDILHSPVEVGAGDEGSEERNDCGSLLHPVPKLHVNSLLKNKIKIII